MYQFTGREETGSQERTKKLTSKTLKTCRSAGVKNKEVFRGM